MGFVCSASSSAAPSVSYRSSQERLTSGRTLTVRPCPYEHTTTALSSTPPSRAPTRSHLWGRLEPVRRGPNLGIQVQLERADDALLAQEVVAVRWDLNLHLVRLASGVTRVRGRLLSPTGQLRAQRGNEATHVLVELEAVLEEELIKLMERWAPGSSARCDAAR